MFTTRGSHVFGREELYAALHRVRATLLRSGLAFSFSVPIGGTVHRGAADRGSDWDCD